ncbi:MAG: hypothetical protein M0T80_14440 [Actinomycetota bacterium]|nr:hypothetical protein [Actinomycetota bacterium]
MGDEAAAEEHGAAAPGDETVLEASARRRAEVAADLPAEEEHPAEAGTPGRVEAWRRRSALGAVLTGIAIGLGEVFEAEREQPAIVQETSGLPPRDLPVQADLGEASPKRSVVQVRPWLLGGADGDLSADREPGDREPAEPSGPLSGEPTAAATARRPPAATRVPARKPARRRLGRRR